MSAAAGFLVAPVVPAVAFSLLYPLAGFEIISILASFAVYYPYSATAVLLLGLPAFLALRPFRPGNWWSVMSVGFLLGVLVAIILRLPSTILHPEDFIVTGPIAAISALVFWLIWKRGAPPPKQRR